jgi:hypothetical protein
MACRTARVRNRHAVTLQRWSAPTSKPDTLIDALQNEALAHFLQRVHAALQRSSAAEGLVMRHPPKLLHDKAIAYRAGAIGLGLLPVAMAFAAVLIP